MPSLPAWLPCPAAHGTNLDGVWVKAKVGLQIHFILSFTVLHLAARCSPCCGPCCACLLFVLAGRESSQGAPPALRARPMGFATAPACTAAPHVPHPTSMPCGPQVPKQLRVGSVLKFGASVREYKVAKLPAPAARR